MSKLLADGMSETDYKRPACRRRRTSRWSQSAWSKFLTCSIRRCALSAVAFAYPINSRDAATALRDAVMGSSRSSGSVIPSRRCIADAAEPAS